MNKFEILLASHVNCLSVVIFRYKYCRHRRKNKTIFSLDNAVGHNALIHVWTEYNHLCSAQKNH